MFYFLNVVKPNVKFCLFGGVYSMLIVHPAERVRLLPLQKKGILGYDTKLYLVVRLQFWSFGGVWNTPSLPLLPGPL